MAEVCVDDTHNKEGYDVRECGCYGNTLDSPQPYKCLLVVIYTTGVFVVVCVCFLVACYNECYT